MKHSDYLKKIESKTGYVEARKKLQPFFDLGNAILRARIEKGWSQAELAKRVGTQQANISRIEDASANPTFRTVQKILSVLGLTTEYKKTQFSTTSSVSYTTSVTGSIYVPNWPTVTDKSSVGSGSEKLL